MAKNPFFFLWRAPGLPTGFLRTRDEPIEAQVPKTDTTDLKFAVDAARATAQLAATLHPTAELGGAIRLFDFRFACHQILFT